MSVNLCEYLLYDNILVNWIYFTWNKLILKNILMFNFFNNEYWKYKDIREEVQNTISMLIFSKACTSFKF